MNCPQCDKWLVNDKECSCGWKSRLSTEKPYDPNHGKCAWTEYGMRCSSVGTLCHSTVDAISPVSGEGTKAKWYCAWHYECITKGLGGYRHGPDYENFCRHELSYALDHDRPKMRDTWDADDETLLKGIIFIKETLDEKSITLRHVPQNCKDAAREFEKTWTPPKHDIPAIDAYECEEMQSENMGSE